MGEIALVPPEQRVSGPNATWVMAPFTHVNPKGSRFSDGSYGVYYAAAALETAIFETAYNFARISEDSEDPPRREPMRVLLGAAACTVHDVTSLPDDERRACLDSNSYTASRRLGARLREGGSDGLYYPSVRHKDGRCIAVYRNGPRSESVGSPRPDDELVSKIKAVIAELPTYGYRRVHAVLKRQALAAGLKLQQASLPGHEGSRPAARSPHWRGGAAP